MARSAFSMEIDRAETASSSVGAGTPRSSAAAAAQRPVPFSPARSTITSTRGRPVSGIVAPQDPRGDLHQVSGQLAAVPASRSARRSGIGRHAQGLAHQPIGLGDRLHDRIFDAVVQHLHEMPGAGSCPGGRSRASPSTRAAILVSTGPRPGRRPPARRRPSGTGRPALPPRRPRGRLRGTQGRWPPAPRRAAPSPRSRHCRHRSTRSPRSRSGRRRSI